jgi:hypothetical protein
MEETNCLSVAFMSVSLELMSSSLEAKVIAFAWNLCNQGS